MCNTIETIFYIEVKLINEKLFFLLVVYATYSDF